MAKTSKAFDSELFKMRKRLLLGSVAASAVSAFAFLSGGSALAQEASGAAAQASGGDEIIVSARRRDESLQDVPIAVTAVSGEALNQFGVQDITYLTQSIPNTTLKVSRGTNSTLTAFIRGVGQQDPVAGFESGVGIYVDDVYLNRPQSAVLDIYDVERVEVLRGPQGTLYGRNTVGGALKYVTKRLGDDPSLKLRGSAGTNGQFDIVGTGELPLSDVFAVGGTVAYFTRNGYGENLTTGEDNYDKDVLAFRASAEFDNDIVFARLSGDYLKDKSNPKGGHRLIPGLFSGAPVLDNVYDSRGGLTGKNEAEAYGATLHVEIALNDQWTLKNIAAWREDESFQLIDFDALPAADIDVPAVYSNEQFTEEFQVLYESDAVAGVAGFYYIDASAHQNADIVLDLAGSFLMLPGLNANLFGDVDTKSWSVFGDLTFDLENIFGLSGVELSVGGRYTSDERSAHVLKRQFLGNTPPFGENPLLLVTTSDFTGEETFTDFSPKASLSWSPNPEHNFYVSYSQGFKGGGFDPRGDSSIVTADIDGDGDVDADDIYEFFLFDPEDVDSYEAGWKASLAGGRITSNLAVFYAEYTNVQIPGSQAGIDPFTMAPTFYGVTTNAGAAEFIGVEWEGRALVGEDIFGPGDAFTLSWGGGWIDADYTEFVTGAPPVDVSDQRVVQNTPEFSGAITTNYSHPMGLAGRDGDIALIAQLSYKSRTHIFEIPNPLLDQGGYGLLDASLVWTSDDGKLQIGVHGKNLLDREYRIAGYNFIAQTPDGGIVSPLTPLLGLEGTETAFYGPPRTITGTIQVQF